MRNYRELKDTEKRKRILWVTNMPAPYRLPIFDLLGEIYELDVYFLLGKNNWRNWNLENKYRTWNYYFLNLRTVVFKEFEFIVGLGLKIKNLSEYDVVILGSWENPVYLRLMRKAKKMNIVVLPIYESHTKSQKFKTGIVAVIRANFFKKANFIVTFGPASTRAVCEMGIEKKVILELFNLVDNFWFQTSLNRNLGTLKIGHTFLFIGQLIERKNIQTAIYAFAHIAGINDKFKIVGEGPQLRLLETLVQELKIERQVDFMGYRDQSELIKIFNDSHTLVLPSKTEVWGLVVNEALACGLHAVVSDQAGISESINGQRGVYITSTGVTEFAQAMQQAKLDWKGWIINPEINSFSKEIFIQRLVERIEVEMHGQFSQKSNN